MLVDIPGFMRRVGADPIFTQMASLGLMGRDTERLSQGIYEIDHFNFDLMISGFIETEYPFDGYEEIWASGDREEGFIGKAMELDQQYREAGYPHAYGVCDYPQQLIEMFPAVESDPRPFVVSMTRISKVHQSDNGGWRWHKWGPYIGTQNPQREYLYDEPEIEEVWVYHIYQLNEMFV